MSRFSTYQNYFCHFHVQSCIISKSYFYTVCTLFIFTFFFNGFPHCIIFTWRRMNCEKEQTTKVRRLQKKIIYWIFTLFTNFSYQYHSVSAVVPSSLLQVSVNLNNLKGIFNRTLYLIYGGWSGVDCSKKQMVHLREHNG